MVSLLLSLPLCLLVALTEETLPGERRGMVQSPMGTQALF